MQVLKEFQLPFRGKEHKVKVGLGVFNLFNHFNPRDAQTTTWTATASGTSLTDRRARLEASLFSDFNE